MIFKTYLAAYNAISRCKTKISSIQKEIEKIEETVKESRKNGGPLTEPSRSSQLIPNVVQRTSPNGVTFYTSSKYTDNGTRWEYQNSPDTNDDSQPRISLVEAVNISLTENAPDWIEKIEYINQK